LDGVVKMARLLTTLMVCPFHCSSFMPLIFELPLK
jgi:hypothetical protein